MSGTVAFDLHAARCEERFERHPSVYRSELLALRRLSPAAGSVQENFGGEAVEDGYGHGAFVVVAAEKPKALPWLGEP